MKNSEQLDDLITRSFSNELNSDDQAFLVQWLSASEENRQYYEALKNTWQLMKDAKSSDEINTDSEWSYFQQVLAHDARGERDYTGDLPGKTGTVRKMLVAAAMAASVLLIIAVGYYWHGNKKTHEVPVVAKAENNHLAEVAVRHEVNTTDKAKRLVLSDSSEIILDPSSEVTWNEPFVNNRRDLILKGRASFHVAKDKTKPFTVYSGHLATTALGTRFTVTAFEQEEVITVQLFEGKVVIKAADSLQPKLEHDFYLLPGEELLYNNKQYAARVRRFIQNNTAAKHKEEEEAADQPLLPVDKGSWYMFNNQPLAQVFKQLEEMYKVHISYSEKDLEKMYFIGKFSKNDSVGNILRQIALLNNLTVTKQNNDYIITNSQ